MSLLSVAGNGWARKMAVAVAAGLAVWPTAAQTPPVLQASDLVVEGYYDLQTNGNDTSYSRGFALRRVGNEVRLLNLQLNGELHEISLAGRSFGDRITSPAVVYREFKGLRELVTFYWDEPRQRLWSTSATDYTADVVPTQIWTHTLPAGGGNVTSRGPISLAGVNAKRVYGGALEFPAWFQQQYGVGPYAVGFGGYTSLMDQGGGASLGPTMYAMGDPESHAAGSTVPRSQYKTLSDFYSSGKRGIRLTIPINYYDGGDPRQNPSTPPVSPPSSRAQWQSPASDGTGWWVWGDHYENMVFVDTPNVRGVVALGAFCTGRAWYMSSTLNCDGRALELHVYDPAVFGRVARGQGGTDSARPASMVQLKDFQQKWTGFQGNGPVGGMAYDAVDQRLYVAGFSAGPDVYTTRVWRIRVPGAPNPAPAVASALTTTPERPTMPTPVAAPRVTTNARLPNGAVKCADEDQTCTWTGGDTRTVYYGADGRFVSKAGQTSPVACTNTNFTDPIPGVLKACYTGGPAQ